MDYLHLLEQIHNEYEFNGYQDAVSGFLECLFQNKYDSVGSKMRLVWLWVSGFNPGVYQMVLSDELDPYRCLLQQLNAERYDAVEQTLGEKRG